MDPAVLGDNPPPSRGRAGWGGRTGSPVPYVELHLHTNYSLLDGASHPEELIARAVRFGYSALAITDHDNLFGAMVFARKCKENGIRAITGVELTLAEAPLAGPRHHLTLLAATREGYGNLCRLISLANGLEEPDEASRKKRRLDPCLPLHRLAAHCRGLVCLTGCRQGEVPTLAAAGMACFWRIRASRARSQWRSPSTVGSSSTRPISSSTSTKTAEKRSTRYATMCRT